MKDKFKPLFESVELPSGSVLTNRFAMAPMVVEGSSYQGTPGTEDLTYFKRRNKTAGLLITGAAAVGPFGNAFGNGLSILDDSQIPAWKDLAQTMKDGGNTAVLQIFHPGRQAKYSYADQGKVVGPSDANFDFLDYPVTGLSSQEVQDYVHYFGQAARRAVEAGFDGVEIHGANHYLIHQFFSKSSNFRQDDWGGSLEKRAHFALAVAQEVKDQVKKAGKSDFIIGYRFSPEEVHDDQVGYDLEESLYLVDKLADLGLDYIHTSQFGPLAFKKKAEVGKYKGQVINSLVKERLAGRALLVGAGDISDPDKALEASQYLDLLAMGASAILKPDLVQTIKAGRDQDYKLEVEEADLADLALPDRFYRMAGSLGVNQSFSDQLVARLKEKPDHLK